MNNQEQASEATEKIHSDAKRTIAAENHLYVALANAAKEDAGRLEGKDYVMRFEVSLFRFGTYIC